MTAGRIASAGIVLLLALACSTRPKPPSTRPDAPDAVGFYRASATDGAGRTTRFRLWLHAARPDRLHLEVLPPVGGASFMLDAGDGAVAASWVHDRLALAGPSDAASMGRLLGMPIDARGWVAAILDGTPAEGVGIEREGPAASLPVTLVLRRGELAVRLERREVARAQGEVGNGRPPEGFTVHPIESMEGPSLLDALLDPRDEAGR